MDFNCARCGSPDTRRLSLIYREGTTEVTTATRGVGAGFTGAGLGIGGATAKTRGTHQTILSKELAPPEKRKIGGPLVAVVLGFALFVAAFMVETTMGVLLLAVTLGAPGALLLKGSLDFNARTYPQLRKRWEDSFICSRCGEVFQVRS